MKFPKLPRVVIYRKVYPPYYTTDNQRVLLVELGRYCSISISRHFADDIYYEPKTPSKILFKKREFVKRIKQYEIIPSWYGFAYYDFDCDASAYMPIPINLIRSGWEWFKWHVLFKIKFDWPHWLVKQRRDIRDAVEALDRLDARHQYPTGTNYHFDIDLVRKTINKVRFL